MNPIIPILTLSSFARVLFAECVSAPGSQFISVRTQT